MAMNKKAPKDIKTYISLQPKEQQANLKKLYQAIKKAAPKATEKISYGMPAFILDKPLAYFASSKKHIGFYPTPSPIKAFAKELEKFETSKGTVRFPIDKPLPLGLISRMVKFRAKEIKGPKNKSKPRIFSGK